MIKGKTPEEIRKLFNIVNDFTPEEEVRVSYVNLTSLSHTFPRVQAQIKKENVSCLQACLGDSTLTRCSFPGMGGGPLGSRSNSRRRIPSFVVALCTCFLTLSSVFIPHVKIQFERR